MAKGPSKVKALDFKSAKEVENYFRKSWNKWCNNCHPDDYMDFTDWIFECEYELKGSGWYWDDDTYNFRKEK